MIFLVDMNEPEYCYECPMHEPEGYSCRLNGMLISGVERPAKCPLKKLIWRSDCMNQKQNKDDGDMTFVCDIIGIGEKKCQPPCLILDNGFTVNGNWKNISELRMMIPNLPTDIPYYFWEDEVHGWVRKEQQ